MKLSIIFILMSCLAQAQVGYFDKLGVGEVYHSNTQMTVGGTATPLITEPNYGLALITILTGTPNQRVSEEILEPEIILSTTGNTDVMASLTVRGPLIDPRGTATIDKVASVYITLPSTAATNQGDLSLLVDAGTSEFDGKVVALSTAIFSRPIVGDDLGAVPYGGNFMQIGGAASNSGFIMGQSFNTGMVWRWRYDSTTANAFAELFTQNYANPVSIDASSISLNASSGGQILLGTSTGNQMYRCDGGTNDGAACFKSTSAACVSCTTGGGSLVSSSVMYK